MVEDLEMDLALNMDVEPMIWIILVNVIVVVLSLVIVVAIMNIHNLDENGKHIEDLYSIPDGENNKPILVSG